MKLSHGLPAVLAAESRAGSPASRPDIVTVDAEAVEQFRDETIRSLTLASEASVPLDSGAQARFVVFRDAIGGNPTAIIVGEPDFSNPCPSGSTRRA